MPAFNEEANIAQAINSCLAAFSQYGLKGEIVKAGKVIDIFDKQNNKRWLIAPYLCKARSAKVRLCHENADFRWVKLSELEDYEFVPGLTKDLRTLGLL